MKKLLKNKQCFLKGQRGGVLPIVLVSILLLQISFFGAFRIYQNKMHTYGILVDHYQSQTLFAFAEKILKEDFLMNDKKAPKIISFNNIGRVEIVTQSLENYQFTSLLSNGFSEEKEIKFVKPTPSDDLPPIKEADKEKISFIELQADDFYRLFFMSKSTKLFHIFS